eukprot:CAMPEP_0177586164 /NCGR_PEP_ID=MMETSP0419_2-20121207/4917_1 /TAXON_ID=582737 /ORGANISM="Tetraselmis sp., Strain GSL018" /LENGTH=1007 /DNA_ID=CAMNT_0019076019 /DNA_START=41 /DNA_END=3065 /DNA_ORIENTATION=+
MKRRPQDTVEDERDSKKPLAASTCALLAIPVKTNTIERAGKSCTHQVFIPEGDERSTSDPPAKLKGPPAREYPFQIDPFQETAINALEAGHDVLVAAHTSAGKTVVAEYAFGMALRDNGRVVYTSPLKALSNQKYREFREEFEDVGLMTGDVTINPTASCLVMTTEILRSMLYNGSEVVREVQIIVYDEIHYMRDRERGVVWEESIILAPKKQGSPSSRRPSPTEFASWVARTHRRPCHVVYTEFRPTPLQHFVHPSGGENLYLVVDDKGVFREDNFQKVVAEVVENKQNSRLAKKKGSAKKETGTGESSDIFKVVRMIVQRNLEPVIVFSFSKSEVEELSNQMVNMDVNTEEEKELVLQVFRNATDCLGVEDRKLPQVNEILPMLKRGIGVHHSGLLPLVKEVIELLFQEGLVKVLFATETFSTGLNMPARTVIFNSVRKFDGYSFRNISSGEYIQMSGRAGRRGLDDRGTVVLMLDGRLDPAAAKDMLYGAPDTLNSEFHLGYNMLLNLAARSDGVSAEELLLQSFRQFQAEAALPRMEEAVAKLERERDAIQVEDEPAVAEYLLMLRQLAALKREIRQTVNSPLHALPFLQPGRLVRVLPPEGQEEDSIRAGTEEGGLPAVAEPEAVMATVVNFERLKAVDAEGHEVKRSRRNPDSYAVDVLVNCGGSPHSRGEAALLPAPDQTGTPQVVAVNLSRVDSLSSIRVYVPQELKSIESRRVALRTMVEVGRRFPKGLPTLDPEDDMRIEDSHLRKSVRKMEHMEAKLKSNPLTKETDLLERLKRMQEKARKQDAVRIAEKDLKMAKSMIFKAELKARMRVLRRLEYIDSEGIVTAKGRFAANIQSADEIVSTELIFDGTFGELTPVQTAALVSCFVWQEKAADKPKKVREDLEGPLAAVKHTARRVAKICSDCKLEIDVEEYVASFRPDMIDVVAAWASGSTFREIMKLTDVFEGSLVRAIRRLHEVLIQFSEACYRVGEYDLQSKFEEASEKIKRDVVFAASLYL